MLTFQDQMKRWGGVAGRSLNRFEQMSIARPFVYSPFFGTWNRIIKPIMSGSPMGIMLLNLTPGTDVHGMRMFVTDTLFRREDKFERQLPSTIMEQLVSAVGHEQAVFMTECDLWPLISVNKFLAEKKLGTEKIPFDHFRLEGTEGMAA